MQFIAVAFGMLGNCDNRGEELVPVRRDDPRQRQVCFFNNLRLNFIVARNKGGHNILTAGLPPLIDGNAMRICCRLTIVRAQLRLRKLKVIQ